MIKVGFLISYDYEYLRISLPLVYDHVDQVYLAVDIDQKTWSGEQIEIAPEFWDWISAFDTDKKIFIYREQFYVSGLTPMECDTRERNLLGKYMGRSDWYLQIDVDEYFIDFPAFINKLRAYQPKDAVTVACRVATLFRQSAGGYLIIGESRETLNFATNNPVYDVARINNSNFVITWDDIVLHQSWARSPHEVYTKLTNWSHRNDFTVDSFFNLWNAIDENNYRSIRHFHPTDPPTWPKLDLIEGDIHNFLGPEGGELINSIIRPKQKKSLASRLWREIRS